MPGIFMPESAHQRYAEGLNKAGLSSTFLGKQWLEASSKSLNDSIPVTIPYREAGYFAADEPRAVSFRLRPRRGQRIIITTEIRPSGQAVLFCELFAIDRNRQNKKLLSSSDSTGKLTYELQEDMELLLRLQPELLVSVSYTLTIIAEPLLAFPVPGNNGKKVGSFWGDSRDAGKRSHEGIDIFDKFRTPVIAAADGIVTRVNENKLGGLSVWMSPSGMSLSLYYAHLDSQIAKPSQRVSKGDTLGLMGNTGNAKHTPTHLHFGIYDNGAVDPLPYVQQVSKETEKIAGNADWLNKALKTNVRTSLLSFPGKNAAAVATLEKAAFVKVNGAVSGYYNVSLPDGKTGFIPVKAVSMLDKEKKASTLTEETVLLAQPDTSKAHMLIIPASARVNAYAFSNGFSLVNYNDRFGWVKNENLK